MGSDRSVNGHLVTQKAKAPTNNLSFDLLDAGLQPELAIVRGPGPVGDFAAIKRIYRPAMNVHATMDRFTGYELDEDLAGRFQGGVLCLSPKGWTNGIPPE